MLSRDEAVALCLALAAALGMILTAILVALPPGGGARSQGPEADCLEWTDSCVVCRRLADGPACSTPGIACVRGPTRCLRKNPA